MAKVIDKKILPTITQEKYEIKKGLKLNFFKQSHSHIPDKTEYKEASAIGTIKRRTKLLTSIVALNTKSIDNRPSG
jgi:hypothetical protein